METDLTEDEQTVLVAIGSIGRFSTGEVAERTGLRRLVVMRVLLGLERKGLVSHHEHVEAVH